ncbi:hypothetical protein NQ317_014027 [Molorchus minor]|uniref:Uncharacterized protein n=1 Tax=Molorchus minor TaxID=1323400 RepID=A0ABQ9JZQ3_9CUCU|nr:hypothetical protein NQ317_014027 [Molorchus minor]
MGPAEGFINIESKSGQPGINVNPFAPPVGERLDWSVPRIFTCPELLLPLLKYVSNIYIARLKKDLIAPFKVIIKLKEHESSLSLSIRKIPIIYYFHENENKNLEHIGFSNSGGSAGVKRIQPLGKYTWADSGGGAGQNMFIIKSFSHFSVEPQSIGKSDYAL